MTDDGRKLVGIPTDSCWLFKASSGKITLYSFLAEEDSYTTIAMQEEDGPIEKLDKENLLLIMGHNYRLRKLIENGKFTEPLNFTTMVKRNEIAWHHIVSFYHSKSFCPAE
jgi:hypothetical protein